MTDLLTEMSRPTWWVSVVVAGFLVNLLAAYAKPLLDRLEARQSAARRRRVAERQRRLDHAVEYLLRHPQELADLKLDSILAVLKATLTSVVAVLLIQFVNAMMDSLELFGEVRGVFLVVLYLFVALGFMSKVRQYFFLRPVLRAYAKSAHTMASRFRDDEFRTV